MIAVAVGQLIGAAAGAATLAGLGWVLYDGWRWQREQRTGGVAQWDRAREAMRREGSGRP